MIDMNTVTDEQADYMNTPMEAVEEIDMLWDKLSAFFPELGGYIETDFCERTARRLVWDIEKAFASLPDKFRAAACVSRPFCSNRRGAQLFNTLFDAFQAFVAPEQINGFDRADGGALFACQSGAYRPQKLTVFHAQLFRNGKQNRVNRVH